ncbi:vanadium-dependent haloperoxidase [Roseibacillus ishigakijimensis]|uniref:Vanadium-dependent haloperoxidase n=1 Tax=Roseibacillus ishigakijimensis TaxID=454146 RepID=A0A934VGT0_9BACT|nr:vanadium-dependent haloperoxidase [Roseibacillus ishigakijimensis]MBK1833193.1 vanadium-dependent haloperoxidase [Roseibacillus ishigakijimensis]
MRSPSSPARGFTVVFQLPCNPVRAFFFACAFLLGSSALQANPAEEDPKAGPAPILAWCDHFFQSVRQDAVAPAQVSRRLALLFISAHDAYQLAADSTSEDCYFKGRMVTAPDSPRHPEVAALAALYQGSEYLFPSHRHSYRKGWQTYREEQLAQGLPAGQFQLSASFGHSVSAETLDLRIEDGASSGRTYVPSREPGQWRRTPPRFRPPELSHWGKVRPFALESPDQFRLPPPPALGSSAYEAALAEVQEAGGQSRANPEDAEIAKFWSCFSYTTTPAGHWNVILCELLAEDPSLSFQEALHRFLVLNITLADTAIACWDSKYHHNFWRPIDAIRAAGDPTWNSRLEAPPHPEYPSGHSSFAGAGSRILQLCYGRDDLSFSTTSDSVPDVEKTYQSLRECAREMGHSRILGGIHFSFSDEGGQKLGRQVADWCWEEVTKRTGSHAKND